MGLDRGTPWSGELVILLAGGDKASQAKDIKVAIGLARQIKEGV
jgi:putative component of toxin-antitoxin plasmid stabilization module